MVTLYLTGTSIRLESKLPVGEHMLEKYRRFKEETPKEFCISRTKRGCFAYLTENYHGKDVVGQATKLDEANEKIIECLSTMKSKDERDLDSCVKILKDCGYDRLADWVHGKLAPVLEAQDGEVEKEPEFSELETQGEQKSVDKAEPKFHEGDWTVSNLDGKVRQISEVHSDEYNSYYVVDGRSLNLKEYDRLHHLWTIWSEEDENIFNNLCQLIDASNDNELTKNGFKSWLKLLKDKVQSQPKQEK